jgi:CRISPR/Cas system-associated exonuclease Cas4 (RecB family)
MDHLSYSSINTFTKCPRQWWVGYVRGVRTPSSPAQVYGTAVHTVLEDMFSGKEVDVKRAVNMAIMKAGKVGTRMSGLLDVAATVDDINSVLMDPSVSSLLAGIVVDPGGVEVKVDFAVEGVPIPVIGFVDVVQANGVPMDIKTSATDWDEDRASRETQPLFYLRGLNAATDEFDFLIWVKNALMPHMYIVRNHYPDFTTRVDKMVLDAWTGMQLYMDPKVMPPACNNARCGCKKLKV